MRWLRNIFQEVFTYRICDPQIAIIIAENFAGTEAAPVINVGGWLLLSLLFGILLLVTQRAERSRRLATFVILLFVASIVSGFGIYRMGNECPLKYGPLCALPQFRDRAMMVAYATTNLAVVTALVCNGLFWLFIGRYNPPGSSDDIRVLGLND